MDEFFNVDTLRVECPVCKRRRKLRELEKHHYKTLGAYMAYQLCKEQCKERATQEHKDRIELFNPFKEDK
jgi:hypothetical protein